jgi:hypothetical protein
MECRIRHYTPRQVILSAAKNLRHGSIEFTKQQGANSKYVLPSPTKDPIEFRIYHYTPRQVILSEAKNLRLGRIESAKQQGANSSNVIPSSARDLMESQKEVPQGDQTLPYIRHISAHNRSQILV